MPFDGTRRVQSAAPQISPWTEAMRLALAGTPIPRSLVARCDADGHDIMELAAVARLHSRQDTT